MIDNINSWIKAAAFLIVIFLIWLSLVVVESFVLIASGLLGIHNPKFRQMFKNTWLTQDFFINKILGGSGETTISSEIGAYATAGSGTGLRMERVVNFGFYTSIGQVNHCRASMKADDEHFTTPIIRAVSIFGYAASILTLNWIF